MKKEEDGVEGDWDEPERNAGAKEHDGKKHKNPKADIAIPFGGILLAAFVGIEGLHQGILMNIPIIMKMIQESLHTYFAGFGL